MMASVPVIAASDRQADEAAIRDVVQTRQQQAWNEHDAKACEARRAGQPCLFLQENKRTITPSPARIAAVVKPVVEISARE
jgi:hypothetical protein